jgi:carboxypeptidase Taq
MKDAIEKLKRYLCEIADLESVTRLLEWDECVYMSPKGATAHARQKSTLARLAHEKFTDPAIGRLLEKLAVMAEDLPYASDEASLIRVTKREYDRAVRIPPRFVARLEEHKSGCYDAWCRAREGDDFSLVSGCLKRGIDLSREYAGFFPDYQHIADPLLEIRDVGMPVSTIGPVLKEMRERLLPLIKAIASLPEPEDSFLYQKYPRIKQLRFGQRVIERCGFDFTRGRQDLSMHPFASNISPDDVRITTCVNENSFFDSFSSTLHEAGHAMYEQGVPGAYEGTTLGTVVSMGIHESQARLWENLVGRSRSFWSFFFPVAKAVFPEQLDGVSLESFCRAINKVKPSLKRSEADEVTYNLHVIIRFDLELALLEGTLEVEELPQAWNERYWSDLGVLPRTQSEGVLQDVHWYCDLFGGEFRSYAIGNIISAVCLDRATRDHPAIYRDMEEGDFGSLSSWLDQNIYRHGAKFTASELVQTFSPEPLPLEPYFRYLYAKYSDLYDLEPARQKPSSSEEREPCTTSMTSSYW